MHQPDEGLFLVCNAARAATEAYRQAADRDATGEALSALLARELDLIAIVTATRVQTTTGLVTKAAALDHFVQANSGSEPPPEAVALIVALAGSTRRKERRGRAQSRRYPYHRGPSRARVVTPLRYQNSGRLNRHASPRRCLSRQIVFLDRQPRDDPRAGRRPHDDGRLRQL